jgi:ubiquinone biosynthesis protein
MASDADTGQLRRTKEIARLLLRYGRSDVLEAAQRDPLLADFEPPPEEAREEGEQLARDLEALGPTFIKLGQLLSTRGDLLPPPYLVALSRLQDEVEPFPYADVERIVAEELGVRISKAFADFEAAPAASASLGQVHRATLRDGRPVAVKVQRPEIRARVLADLEALERLVAFVDEHSERARRFRLTELLEEFRRTLLAELDYRREAQNLVAVGRSLERFERLFVPRPIDDYSTSRVLTMEYVQGAKLDDVSPLARLELDGAAIADELFEAYLVQVLVDGLFHADPHPGNILLTRDGRLALIDLGMVGHIAPGMRDRLLKLLIALGEGQSDEVADHALAMSTTTAESDLERFRQEVNHRVLSLRDTAIEDIAVGRVIQEIVLLAGDCGVWMPMELSLLGKALLNLDHIARTLDPGFDPNAAIRRHAGELLRNDREQGCGACGTGRPGDRCAPCEAVVVIPDNERATVVAAGAARSRTPTSSTTRCPSARRTTRRLLLIQDRSSTRSARPTSSSARASSAARTACSSSGTRSATGPDDAVEHAHGPQPHRHGDLLQGLPPRDPRGRRAQVEALRHRARADRQDGEARRPHLGGADLLPRPHLRRGQEDRLEGRRLGDLVHHPV